MEKEVGKVVYKKKSRVGTFLLGWLFGFLLTIGLLVGAVYLVYTKGSVENFNKIFKTNLDLGSDELNKKTIKQLAGSAMDFASDIDNYTLARLKADFGIDIGDDIAGLDISDLKDVKFSEFTTKLGNKLSNITIDEINNIDGVSLSGMENITNKKVTYQVRDNAGTKKLYKSNTSPLEEVEFEYTIEGNNVVVKGQTYPIETNTEDGTMFVKIGIKYLPLQNAIGDYTSNLGNEITLKELEDDYGVSLPKYFNSVDKEHTTINQLQEEIDKLYLADFLDYTIVDGKVFDKNNKEITGAIATLAKKTVKELDSLEETLNGMTIAEVMDYKLVSGAYYDKDNVKVTGIMSKIADFKVEELSEKIDDLTLADIMDYTLVSGKYYDVNNKEVTGVMNKLADTKVGELSNIKSKIDAMTIAEVMDFKSDATHGYYVDENSNGQYDAGEEISGVMKAIANTTIENLNSDISNMTVAKALDLNIKLDASTNKYYNDKNNNGTKDTGEEEISNIIYAIHDAKINDLTSRIDSLQVKDLFTDTSTGVISLIPDTTKITDISTELQTAVQNATLFQLKAKGVISTDDATLQKSLGGVQLGSLTIEGLLDAVASYAS